MTPQEWFFTAIVAANALSNVLLSLHLVRKGTTNMAVSPQIQGQVDELANIAGGLQAMIQSKVDAAVALAKKDYQKDRDDVVSALQSQIAGIKSALGV